MAGGMLHWIEVRHRGTALDAADAGDGTTGVQQGLEQCGLAGAGVSGQRDITDLVAAGRHDRLLARAMATDLQCTPDRSSTIAPAPVPRVFIALRQVQSHTRSERRPEERRVGKECVLTCKYTWFT